MSKKPKKALGFKPKKVKANAAQPIMYGIVALFAFDDEDDPPELNTLQIGKTKGLPLGGYDWDWGFTKGNFAFADGIPADWAWTHVGVATFPTVREADDYLKTPEYEFMKNNAVLIFHTAITNYF